jgi:hypothetical protein
VADRESNAPDGAGLLVPVGCRVLVLVGVLAATAAAAAVVAFPFPPIASKRRTMSEMDVRRVRCARASGAGTPRPVLPESTGDGMGNFTAAVVGELRNMDWGRGRAVPVPADAEGGGPASRPFVDCLRCLGEGRVGEGCSRFVESVDIDGDVSGCGEAERGFGGWSTGGNNKVLPEPAMSSGSREAGFGPGDRRLSPEDLARTSFPPQRSTNSWTEP